MDKFVSPASGRPARPQDQRIEAARLAQSARDDIKRALDGVRPDDAVRRRRDKLREAVAKNPRSPQFFYELAVVEQDLKDLESARTHLTKATDIAREQPALLPPAHASSAGSSAAGEAPRRAAHLDLAPATPTSVAKYAALAVAAARAATP
jgi:hypothetical protein